MGLPSLGPSIAQGGVPREDPPVGLSGGRAGVLRGIIGRRGQWRHKLIKIQGLVEDSAVRGHAGRADGRRPLWKELQNREVPRSGRLLWL